MHNIKEYIFEKLHLDKNTKTEFKNKILIFPRLLEDNDDKYELFNSIDDALKYLFSNKLIPGVSYEINEKYIEEFVKLYYHGSVKSFNNFIKNNNIKPVTNYLINKLKNYK